MVARGDLGVELRPRGAAAAEEDRRHGAAQAGKPVIVATQMLESMIVSPTPTRAEVIDVVNAIYEGVDAVMLSAETAAGPSGGSGDDDGLHRPQVEHDRSLSGADPFHARRQPRRPPPTLCRTAPRMTVAARFRSTPSRLFTSTGSLGAADRARAAVGRPW